MYCPENTSVVLLAAGRGQRMRELTERTPKPLLKVGTHSLIEHHLLRLAEQGFKQVVINLAYQGEQIKSALADGSLYGSNIVYSDEAQTGALETAGGLKKALPLIQSDPFIVVNADIWTDYEFTSLLSPLSTSGRLVLVPNPEHNSSGDFALNDRALNLTDDNKLTFSGIALYRKSVFEALAPGKLALGPVLKSLIKHNDLEGVCHQGDWTDVGTPERLYELNERVNTIRN